LLPEDKKLSFEWAEKSAAQGNVNAIMKVAAYYEGGYYVDKDGEKAFKYQLFAAEKGSLGAAYAVGVHYSTGNGIKSDRNESIKWFKVAAYGGLIEAQKTLIYIYAKGDGVPRDYIESLAWTYIVGSNGRDEDKEKIDELEKAAGQETAIKAQERARLILADIKRVNPDYKPQSFFENMGIAKEICENKEVPSSESNDVGIAKAYYYSNLKEFAKDGKVLPFIEVKDKILKTLRNQ
jgi:hypothetical protein